MIKEQIIAQLQSILKEFGVSDATPQLDIPTDLSHGDYTTNIAMQLSKQLKKSPMEIAEKIVSQLQINNYQLRIEKIEAVKPGFVNFWIAKEALVKNLRNVSEKTTASLSDKKILVEYAHPNTHKEMHIGHMRTLITGEALSRLFEYQGAEVFRANYQGDIGPHVAKALYGIKKIMEEKKITLEEIEMWSNVNKAKFLGEGYVRGNKDYDQETMEIDEINKTIYASVGAGLASDLSETSSNASSNRTPARGIPTIDYISLYQTTRQWSLDYYEEFYTRFMTTFNELFFESNMVKSGTEIVRKNIGKIFLENDGTVIFPGEKYGLHTRVFITKAGYPTYEGKEMGNGFAEYKAFAFDKKMHIVGSEQTGYFQVIFKALELLAPDKFKDKQYHLPMGMVQFLDRKMSSRTGDILRVDWLIDQVKDAVRTMFTEEKIALEKKEVLLEQIAIGAIKYSILKVSPKQDVKFDIQTSVSLQGNSGPYLQYTYARTQSIIRKSFHFIPTVVEGSSATEFIKDSEENFKTDAKRFLDFARNDKAGDSLLYNKEHYEIEELSLLRQMYQFSEVVERAAESYSPNILCEYLFTLAQEFNLFYQKHRIIDAADQNDQQFRLQITHAVGQVLQKGLQLLGIATPEAM